jgi:hypothetical protein
MPPPPVISVTYWVPWPVPAPHFYIWSVHLLEALLNLFYHLVCNCNVCFTYGISSQLCFIILSCCSVQGCSVLLLCIRFTVCLVSTCQEPGIRNQSSLLITITFITHASQGKQPLFYKILCILLNFLYYGTTHGAEPRCFITDDIYSLNK